MTNINKVLTFLMPFGKSGNIYLLGALGQGLGPIIVTPILTRILNVKTFGEITFITAFAAILGILFSLGLPIVISRSYILEEESRFTIISWLRRLVIVYLTISALVIVLISNNPFSIIVATALPLSCMQLILPLARAQEKYIQFALISMFGTLIPSAGVILNYYFGSFVKPQQSLAIGTIFGALLSFILISFKRINGEKLPSFTFTKSIKVGYSILPHMIGMVALLNIDKVIFGNQIDKTSAGFLQVIMLIGTAPILVLSALNHAWLNKILLKLKSNSQDAVKYLNQTIFRLFLLSFFLIIFIIIFKSFILKTLNPNLIIYENVNKTIILMTLGSFIYIIYLANTHLLTWQKDFWVLGITTPTSITLQAIVIYLTVDYLEYLSAAIGFGSALTLQVLLLEFFRNNTETKNNINRNYLISSIILFWFFAILFLFL